MVVAFSLVSILATTLKSLRLLSLLGRGTDTGGTYLSFLDCSFAVIEVRQRRVKVLTVSGLSLFHLFHAVCISLSFYVSKCLSTSTFSSLCGFASFTEGLKRLTLHRIIPVPPGFRSPTRKPCQELGTVFSREINLSISCYLRPLPVFTARLPFKSTGSCAPCKEDEVPIGMRGDRV